MTLVARVAFLVLVGATFAAFFVAQRLKSSPPVDPGQRARGAVLAQRRRPRDVNRFSLTLAQGDR